MGSFWSQLSLISSWWRKYFYFRNQFFSIWWLQDLVEFKSLMSCYLLLLKSRWRLWIIWLQSRGYFSFAFHLCWISEIKYYGIGWKFSFLTHLCRLLLTNGFLMHLYIEHEVVQIRCLTSQNTYPRSIVLVCSFLVWLKPNPKHFHHVALSLL